MRALESMIPAARLVVIPEAGHFLWFERPDAGSLEITSFVLASDAFAHVTP